MTRGVRVSPVGYARRWPVVGVPRAMAVRSALVTTAFHMLATYPFVYFPCFFLVTETVGHGRTLAEVKAKVCDQTWAIYKVSFCAWTPFFLAQFFFVPLPLQVVFLNVGSFVWTCFLSFRYGGGGGVGGGGNCSEAPTAAEVPPTRGATGEAATAK